jgi:NAD(P)-dependent dehydrogenase (short-subunit alcohol dehydrogenase family)
MWGLVNNAGISTFGEVEFTSMETYKEVAEVNLWGTVRTTKSFLPLLRRAKGKLKRQLFPVPWACPTPFIFAQKGNACPSRATSTTARPSS